MMLKLIRARVWFQWIHFASYNENYTFAKFLKN